MKKPGVRGTVSLKIMFGYGMLCLFSVVFMLLAFFSNRYVSRQYEAAVSELVSLNSLKSELETLNTGINTIYLFLDEQEIDEVAGRLESLDEALGQMKSVQEQHFVREVTDAVYMTGSYVRRSRELLEALQTYFDENRTSLDNDMADLYRELQEVYSYAGLQFQAAYSVELTGLSRLEQALYRMQKRINYAQLILLLAVAGFTLTYLQRVIREMSRSIATLQKGMKEVQRDVLAAKPIEIRSGDEIEDFAETFNEMTALIQTQLRQLSESADIRDRLAQMEIQNLQMFSELQKSHLDFLQSRVNPHFLFNTLNMISSLARIEGADQCAELMETTAAFLRYNLDNISKTVTLERELDNLRDYIRIQRCRYGERYSYEFDVDESCLQFPMPCMILQPLVENAIKHGLAMRMEGGAVEIRVSRAEGRVRISASDNGVGMTEEQIRKICTSLDEKQPSGSHIGIRNIYKRLCMYYHDDVGFEIRRLEPGLQIMISLPEGVPLHEEHNDRNSG